MFSQIPENSKPVVFIGNSASGWENLAAWNPIDSISLSLDDPPEELVQFVKKYSGKFVAGFITYEYGAKGLDVPIHPLNGHLPAVHFRAYESYQMIDQFDLLDFTEWLPFTPTITKEKYSLDFDRIIDYIKCGEFYQMNYTYPMVSSTELSPRSLFQSYRAKNQVEYSAYMEDDSWAIHSLSPEQFIIIQDRIISTKPIKGTIARSHDPELDQVLLDRLLGSQKDQAELYMIIDLLRNDLGKVCEFGSVQVMESKSVQKLEKVFHTYGLIKGKLKKNIHPIEALISMLPGGSISGCPKKRVCEAIYELESHSRGIYTGTIGYILPDGTLQFNIAIRTVLQQGKELILGVGGGITIGSKMDDEFNESLTKAASFQP
ncbi:MAG: anthranilate synthase component I family protein [Candidatus Marinimicrobia bacterium]|nr:anthranilate synthase component I family protein [Candidatus Neomarinimicrobiota bacterium]